MSKALEVAVVGALSAGILVGMGFADDIAERLLESAHCLESLGCHDDKGVELDGPAGRLVTQGLGEVTVNSLND